MTVVRLLSSVLLAIALTACGTPDAPRITDATNDRTATSEPVPVPVPVQPPDGHNSRNALDWAGVYAGIVPCADCPGIYTRVELTQDERFRRSVEYLERGGSPFADEGRFVWDDAGARITLTDDEGNTQMYQVGENVLFHLDRDGQRITGERASAYRLEKTVSDERLENRRWRLVELNGRPVDHPDRGDGAYLRFDSSQTNAAGNGSCNHFSGSYDLLSGNRLRIGTLTSTMMACDDLDQERAFFEALGRADNYTLGDDDSLSLNRARMAPLARFVAVND